MAKKRRKAGSLPRPALGRNLAVRPGAGPHVPDEEKRAHQRLRREIEEQREPGQREPDQREPEQREPGQRER